MTALLKKPMKKKVDGVRAGLPALALCERRHDLYAGLAEELGDGNDVIAFGAQGLDEDGQGGDCYGAVSAAVVEQDDGTAAVGVGVHVGELLEDGAGDLLRSFTGVLIPVVVSILSPMMT